MRAVNVDCERDLLGDLLSLPHRIPEAELVVTAADFASPLHAAIFQALCDLWHQGEKPDAGLVANRVRTVVPTPDLDRQISLLSTAGSGVWQATAERVADLSRRRKLLKAAEVLGRAADETEPSADLLDEAGSVLAEVDTPAGRTPSDLWHLPAFYDRPDNRKAAWVVHGLVREDWRVMLVAPEGVGKSVLLRQAAICAAQGVHPLTFKPIPAVPTLIVDLENPADIIDEVCRPISQQALRHVRTDEAGPAWLWHRPGGINLRSRSDKAELAAICHAVRPKLVCLGPMYKSYRVQPRESDEQAAADMQNVLDDLRTRFGFGLLMEHHAPKGQDGKRDLVPFGSSLWLRWCEIGLKLIPDEAGNLRVGKWRGDRTHNNWPSELVRSAPWPWAGRWEDGMP